MPSQDKIEKHVELAAPVTRVWRALTDYQEFGRWFGVRLEGPFMPGKPTRGNITYPGYEHVVMAVAVQKMEPERLFSFHWLLMPSIPTSTTRRNRPPWSSSSSRRALQVRA